MKKMTEHRPYADAEKAPRRLMEHARAFEPIQDGRIYIEKLNGPLLYGDKATPAEYMAGLKFAIERGWLEPVHESGTFTRMTQAGKDLFAWKMPQLLSGKIQELGHSGHLESPPAGGGLYIRDRG
ncbi:hypothetical protein [Bradyrhizobium sp. NAS96.2]|uniref:hypothetical protein n=1 Tax=Bradyrhizobium sp. NAS96.2 TaxID=1680160 RepID=UPI000A866313